MGNLGSLAADEWSLLVRCHLTLRTAFIFFVGAVTAEAATTQKHYYAHDAVEDEYGVIAPWYTGQNGQLDLRIRIAAETLKRYPWTDTKKAVATLPEFIFSGAWKITADGTITIPPISDWANGDLGQRASYLLSGLIDYYRYSGDSAAVAMITLQTDALLDYGLTPADHPWPEFLISVPTRGKPYGESDPQGFIQLDIVAEVGVAMVHAAEMTGNERWMKAARHWGDLFAAKRSRVPGEPPWPRYANPEVVPWDDHATGGVAFILEFFDALIRTGYTGKDGAIIEARKAGVEYLHDVLLPKWAVNDTWGRNYWDWVDNVQAENVTEFVVRYIVEHPDEFPEWRTDARNVLSLFLNHTSVAPGSRGDVYSGAWAYPESSSCCGRSLWYGPLELAGNYAQYGLLADSEWGRELARRQFILATYDVHETGVVEDNIDGGEIVAGAWFKIAHPMALKYSLSAMAWMPEQFGPSRENHIMRSASVVKDVVYDAGRILYTTASPAASAPKLPEIDVLRLAFKPTKVRAGDIGGQSRELAEAPIADKNGYALKALSDGDCIMTVRHDGAMRVSIEGDHPEQQIVNEGSTQTLNFEGNRVRVMGSVDETGGLADVYLDGVKQLVGIDCWNPTPRHHQTLYYRNGLASGKHELKIVPRGRGNPVSKGKTVNIEKLLASAAEGKSNFGSGGGPKDAQRMIFGYTGRTDFVDSRGNSWRPGTEFVIRNGHGADSVAASWYTQRRQLQITSTDDPELYRYGIHGRDFWVDFTVGPGTYHVRLKFAETRNIDPRQRVFNIAINGGEVARDFDIASTALKGQSTTTQPTGWGHATWTGLNRAVDLVFNDVQPKNGVISIRLANPSDGEAIVQAVEVAPGDGGAGSTPVSASQLATPTAAGARGNLLANANFEKGLTGHQGSLGTTASADGWHYVFAGSRTAYIWPESAYSAHPDWGGPEFHGGKEALRTHADVDGRTMIWQEVTASPDTKYVGSVWVRAFDQHEKGFGRNTCDSAGLIVQELDGDGRLLVAHPKQAVTSAGPYKKLGIALKTTKNTRRIRYVLDTVITGPYNEGHVTYDDCSLLREAD